MVNSGRKINPYLAVTLILSLVFILYNIREGSLVNSDDAIYAQIIKGILSSGEWLGLKWLDFDYHTKPPLFFWMGALSAKAFSLSEYALRMPAAISAFLTVLLLFAYMRKKWGDQAAFIGSFALFNFTLFLNLSRRVMIDVPLLLFVCLAIFSFDRALERPKYFYAAYLSLAAAFMLKGFAFAPAIIIPLVYFIITGKWRSLLSRDSLAGFFMMLVFALPWYIYKAVSVGSLFSRKFFSGQVVNHYAGRGFELFNKPFLYYAQQFYALDYEMAMALVFAIVLLFVLYKRKELGDFLLPFVWIALYFLFYSFSRAKVDHYIIGLYPPVAMIIGASLSRVNIKLRGTGHIFCAMALAGALLEFLPYAHSTSWHVDSSGPIKRLVLKHNAITRGEGTLYLYQIYLASAVFYSKAKVIEIEPDQRLYRTVHSIDEFRYTNSVVNLSTDGLKELASSKTRFYCLIKEEDFVRLKDIHPWVKKLGQDGTYLLISGISRP